MKVSRYGRDSKSALRHLYGELHGGTVPPQNDKEVITWTDDELDAFDKLVESQWSPDPTRRFETKTEMANFEKVHGHEKCSAMFWHLESMSKKPWEK